jgi:hypothetical protein
VVDDPPFEGGQGPGGAPRPHPSVHCLTPSPTAEQDGSRTEDDCGPGLAFPHEGGVPGSRGASVCMRSSTASTTSTGESPRARTSAARGYLDRAGHMAIAPQFADARPFSDGMAQVGMTDQWDELKYGYVDRTGTLVILAGYAKTFPFSAALGRIGSDGRYAGVDRTGKGVTPADIDFIGIALAACTSTPRARCSGRRPSRSIAPWSRRGGGHSHQKCGRRSRAAP